MDFFKFFTINAAAAYDEELENLPVEEEHGGGGGATGQCVIA
jgi:hypothetical protein